MHDTTAGNASAKSALLTQADLGKGWSGKASPQSGVNFGCSGFEPSGAGVVEVGGATGPSFSYGTTGTGPFILQKSSVYQTTGQAELYWKRSVKPGLVKCVVGVLKAVEARGVKVTILQQGGLKFQSSLPRHAGYRVAATLQGKTNKYKNYVDVLVFGEGRTITTVLITSYLVAPPANFEAIIAHDIAKKLTGGTA